ncbi:MAG: glycosyltransferase [Paludibacteraceae bacterium]|nr:glycosyltransferase [Paludibacteraceae bacterium]
MNFLATFLRLKKRWVDLSVSTESSSASLCYAITVCNEADELRKLLTLLSQYKQQHDTILVQKDQNHVSSEVLALLDEFSDLVDHQTLFPLNDDFATFKNNLLKNTSSDYIFQLDADELPSPYLLEHIHSIIAHNPQIEAFRLPRVNLIRQENQTLPVWNDMDGIDPSEYYHFPDYQFRIFKNLPSIHWHKRVHEVIIGYKTYSLLPKDAKYAILHAKYQSKQEKQLRYYSELKKKS